MTSSITRAELERLRQIEQLAREAVKPNPPEIHQQALAALRSALASADPPSSRDLLRAAVTQQIIPKDD